MPMRIVIEVTATGAHELRDWGFLPSAFVSSVDPTHPRARPFASLRAGYLGGCPDQTPAARMPAGNDETEGGASSRAYQCGQVEGG